MNIPWFEKIPYLKQAKEFFSNIEYKSVNLWPIMAGEIYTYYYFSTMDKKEEPNFFKKSLMSIKSLFFRDKVNITDQGGNLLVSCFINRKDHFDLIKKALEKFDEKDLIWIIPKKFNHHFLRYKFEMPKLGLLFWIWKNFKKHNLKLIFGKYYHFFLLRTYLRCREIEEYSKILDKYHPRAYLSFCSQAFAVEAILTNIAKNEKIPTFNLQHGLLPTNNKVAFSSLEILNENIISDYNLVWGKNSYDIQKKFVDPSKLIISGNPKYSLKEINKKDKFNPKRGAIFFSVPSYNEGNKKLLEIVREFIKNHPEISFTITAHPLNDIRLFSKDMNFPNVVIANKEASAKSILENADFVILYNTTVTIEALNYRIPILRYEDKDFFNLLDTKYDLFQTIDNLEILYKKLYNEIFFKNLLNIYNKELRNLFYFSQKKEPSEVYYENITNLIKSYKK